MSFLAFTGLINFITSLFAGIFIFYKNPRAQLNRLAFLVNAGIALYSLGYFFWQIETSISIAANWFNILVTGIILIQVAFLHFVFSFTEILEKRKKEILFYYVISVIFIIIHFTCGFFHNLEPRFNLGYWPDPKPVFHVYLAFWLWQCVYGMYWLLKGLNTFTGLKREQLKYIILSAIAGFLGGASNWPLWYSINLPPYTNILITLYVLILFYAIIRHRLLNIRIMLTHASLFILVYTCILAIPLVIAHFTGYGLIPFLVLFALAVTGNILYRYLQQKANTLINARQNDYYQVLYEASQSIVRERNLDRLLRTIVIGVKRLLKVDFVKIYLDNQETSSYRLRAMVPRNRPSAPDEFLYDDPVVEIIREAGTAITGDEIQRYTTLLPDTILLIVPFIIDDTMLGFITIGDHGSGISFTRDELELSEIMAYHASLAIENCLYVSEIRDVQEKLFQAEKKSFIAGMAEGVAHQINNRLNYFSLSSAELNMTVDRFIDKHPELASQKSVKRLADTILNIGNNLVENVRRTSNIINGVINYSNIAKESTGTSSIIFKDLLQEALNLVRINHDIDEITIHTEINSPGTIEGIRSQLIEVLFNLLDNSFDAIETKRNFIQQGKNDNVNFKPAITVRLVENKKTHLIELHDNGTGIKDEDMNKIFAPYYSSKSTARTKLNSGLGLYSVNRIIEENHGGKIWFDSEYMTGTTFYIKLPVIENLQ